ncbi:MAG: phage portal protein [Methylococcaceae bacterium]|nr:MAG: phage portal protein [Methylococcaceae bacterium]
MDAAYSAKAVSLRSMAKVKHPSVTTGDSGLSMTGYGYHGQGSHAAASTTDPAFRTWTPLAASADADTLPDITTLMSRARDADRNNGVVHGALQTYADNIVGHQLRLSAKPDYRLLGWDREAAREWGNGVESQFRTWAEEPEECDAAGQLTFLGLTLLMLRSAMLNGDALAVPLWEPEPHLKWSTRLMLIESDRLATPPHLSANPLLRGGIEVNDKGKPQAYWILKSHPGDRYGLLQAGPNDYERIPAKTPWGRPRVIHLHDKERTGQSRGKPIFTAVMRQFHLAGRYADADLDATVANAMVLAFLESTLPAEEASRLFEEERPFGAPKPGEAIPNAYFQKLRDYRPTLRSNTVVPVPPGASLKFHQPTRPNAQFGAFMTAVYRHAAAGLNMPYELLLKDFSQTNYSSARAALLEAWRYFLGRRRWLSDYWLRPCYKIWMEEAVDKSRIAAPGFYDHQFAYTRASWVFAGRGWVDPGKEIDAVEGRIRVGVTSRSMECAEQGEDFEDVADQRAYEKRYLQERGLWEEPQAATSKAPKAYASDNEPSPKVDPPSEDA